MSGYKSKYQSLVELLQSHAFEITQSPEAWADFLDTSARMYKYQFADWVLIHAQRPDATACATMQFWNDHFGRWIKAGSKGIGLLGPPESSDKLRWIFDISDTRETTHSRHPFIWKLRAEHQENILSLLEDATPKEKTPQDALMGMAIRFVEGYNQVNKEVNKLLAHSAAYLALARCGFDPAALKRRFRNNHAPAKP